MGGKDHRHALLAERPDLVPDHPPGLGVQAGGRLIQDEHLGVVHHGLGHHQAALHTTGQVVYLGVPFGLELGELQHLVDLGVDPGAGDAMELGVVLKVLIHVDVPVQHVVLGDHAYPVLHLPGVLDDVQAQHRGSPAGGMCEATQHAYDGGLASPVGPQQPEYLTAGYLQVHPVDGDQVAEALGQSFETDDHVLVHPWAACRRTVNTFRGGER